jgi:hypothetical protein
MNNNFTINVLVKEHTNYKQVIDENIVSIKSNITANKNQILRHFINNTDKEYCLIYNTNSELRTYTYDELLDVTNSYIAATLNTGINFFTGIITPNVTLDYGDVKLNIGTGSEQKIILEFFTRKAINAIGYLDVRLQDTLCAQDYAIRLGATKHYPARAAKTAPWLFDIVHNTTQYAKQVLDTYASGWYQYKHGTLPWEQFTANIEDLKPNLKEIKNGANT